MFCTSPYLALLTLYSVSLWLLTFRHCLLFPLSSCRKDIADSGNLQSRGLGQGTSSGGESTIAGPRASKIFSDKFTQPLKNFLQPRGRFSSPPPNRPYPLLRECPGSSVFFALPQTAPSPFPPPSFSPLAATLRPWPCFRLVLQPRQTAAPGYSNLPHSLEFPGPPA